MTFAILRSLRCLVLVLATLTGGVSAALAAAPQEARQPVAAGKNYLLAVGICPPYRKDIPVEVCSNGVEALAVRFSQRLGIEKADIITLTDASSTGANFLRTLSDLAGKLTAEDRLILYLNAHGDAFSEWAHFFDDSGMIAQVNKTYVRPDEDVIVFWTRDEPAVPALALAAREWLTVSEIVDAIETIPARVALMLDSCSSGRVFGGFHRHVKRSDRIDYILASAGSQQVANINPGETMPLFTQQLVYALDVPGVHDFGAAVDFARITTVQMTQSMCATQTVSRSVFARMFPNLAVPAATDLEGNVSLPLWSCAQVPSVADYSDKMTSMPLATAPKTTDTSAPQ